ncbi:hypothetical protein AB4Z46_07920 [Variovorax sp. M-6]|uniref:hypothetical protein n=1 Tax=Variovorax sp. M-6 TaxID=3233041 RepID=UPI003F9CD75D
MTKRIIGLACAVWAAVALSGSASAQGDGGSQTPCELQYSTCTQTANADYQFCVQASQSNCQQHLNEALQRCSDAQTRCNMATGNY